MQPWHSATAACAMWAAWRHSTNSDNSPLCKFAARIRSGWRSTKPTSWEGSTGRRTLHPCNFHEDCKQPHDQDKQTWSTRTSNLKWTKKHGWRIIHVAGHACELIALQTSLIYVYALQMRTPCSSTRTGKRISRRSEADSWQDGFTRTNPTSGQKAACGRRWRRPAEPKGPPPAGVPSIKSTLQPGPRHI